jgi:hypothetical protein
MQCAFDMQRLVRCALHERKPRILGNGHGGSANSALIWPLIILADDETTRL